MSSAAWIKSPRGRFVMHRKNAKRRDIPFFMTFDQWWEIWQTSGHWKQRGRGRRKYVMARFGDCGGYEVGNIKIILNSENSSEGNLGKISPPAQRAAAAASNKRRVWTLRARKEIARKSKQRSVICPRNKKGQWVSFQF